jgi:hypothetical protein
MKEQFIRIKNGNTRYYSDRKMTILHREDGPAIDYASGFKEWWINGKLHREDGPAIVWARGYKAWYLNGKRLTEEEFNALMNPVELTLDEIAKKFGVSVDKLKIKK